MKKIIKFISDFLITTSIAYLALPIAIFVFAFVVEFITNFKELTIKNTTDALFSVVDLRNCMALRILFIISITIGLYYASEGQNLIQKKK